LKSCEELSRSRRHQTGVVGGNDDRRLAHRPFERVRQCHWEHGCEKIHVELQIPFAVLPVNCQAATTPVIRGYQIQRHTPRCEHLVTQMTAWLFPAELRIRAGDHFQAVAAGQFTGQMKQSQVESIKIVIAKCSHQNAANLIVVGTHFQFFGGSADREVVDEYLPLLHGAMRDPPEFAELQIIEMLYSDPNSSTENSEN